MQSHYSPPPFPSNVTAIWIRNRKCCEETLAGIHNRIYHLANGEMSDGANDDLTNELADLELQWQSFQRLNDCLSAYFSYEENDVEKQLEVEERYFKSRSLGRRRLDEWKEKMETDRVSQREIKFEQMILSFSSNLQSFASSILKQPVHPSTGEPSEQTKAAQPLAGGTTGGDTPPLPQVDTSGFRPVGLKPTHSVAHDPPQPSKIQQQTKSAVTSPQPKAAVSCWVDQQSLPQSAGSVAHRTKAARPDRGATGVSITSLPRQLTGGRNLSLHRQPSLPSGRSSGHFTKALHPPHRGLTGGRNNSLPIQPPPQSAGPAAHHTKAARPRRGVTGKSSASFPRQLLLPSAVSSGHRTKALRPRHEGVAEGGSNVSLPNQPAHSAEPAAHHTKAALPRRGVTGGSIASLPNQPSLQSAGSSGHPTKAASPPGGETRRKISSHLQQVPVERIFFLPRQLLIPSAGPAAHLTNATCPPGRVTGGSTVFLPKTTTRREPSLSPPTTTRRMHRLSPPSKLTFGFERPNGAELYQH